MKFMNEKGITLISLAITIIVLLIIAGSGIMIGLDGIKTIDQSKQAGVEMEKTSIIEALKGEVEELRTIKMIRGQEITDSDIEQIMEAFVKQTNSVKTDDEKKELTYTDKKIISIKDFEITVAEVKAE